MKRFGRAEETIVYHPRLNAAVSHSALTFHPELAPLSWHWLLDGQVYPMTLATVATGLALLLNVIHRRIVRRRWRGRECWLTPMTKRRVVGMVAIVSVCFGMWLGGSELGDVVRNMLLAIFTLQGGFML